MANTPAQVALDERALLKARNVVKSHDIATIDYALEVGIRAYLSSLSNEAGDDGQGALVERLRGEPDFFPWPERLLNDAADRIKAITRENAALRADKERLERELKREEQSHESTIGQRDAAEEWADKLARAIGGDSIGEHSNINNPWANALEAALAAPVSQEPVADKWAIDTSTDNPILTYEKCSVIQDEQAHYVMGLIRRDAGEPSEAEVRQAGDILMQHGLNAPEQVIYGAARALLASKSKGGQADG